MAMHDVFVSVDFLDAAERTATVRYKLVQQYDDTTPASWGTVMTKVGMLITSLNVLTMSAIPSYRVELAQVGAGSANVAANNQIRAFSRCKQDVTDLKWSFEVPAWDDIVFDQDSHNLLSAAYNTAAIDVIDQLRPDHPLAGAGGSVIEWSQSRTRKSRNVLS